MICAGDGSAALYDDAADIPESICVPLAYSYPDSFSYTETDSADSLQGVVEIVLHNFYSSIPVVIGLVAAIMFTTWSIRWILSKIR